MRISDSVRCFPCWFRNDDDDSIVTTSNSSVSRPVLRFSLLLMMCSVALVVGVVLKMRVDYVFGASYFVDSSPHQWVLVGGLSSTGATFRLRYNESSAATLKVYRAIDDKVVFTYQTGNSTLNTTDTGTTKGLDQATATQILEPNTNYKYTWTTATREVLGTFATPAAEGTRFNFSVVAATCAYTGSQSSIFLEASLASTASGNKPLFVMHGGDFHYENLATTDIQERMDAVDRVLSSSTQSLLFQSTALVYMWDDHDWLGNDSTQQGQSENVIEVALQSYHEFFPYYQPLPSSFQTINGSVWTTTSSNTSPYHAFTIGTVRFILTDLVSENTGARIFSEAQMEWFLSELKNASSYDFVIWLSTKPWIGSFEADDSGWVGHVTERTRISNVIQQYIANGKQNLLVVAGDSHMVAFDDGRNTHYSSDGATTANNTIKSFPILQTAPWDNFGSVKGGPYSDGCNTVLYEPVNRYSVIDFIYEDPLDPCIQINSYGLGHKKIFSKKLCGSLFAPIVTNGDDSSSYYISKDASQSCTAPAYLSTSSYIAFGVSFAFLFLFMVVVFLYYTCFEATWMIVLAIFYYVFTLALASVGVGWVTGVKMINTNFIGAMLAIQMAVALIFVVIQKSCTHGEKNGIVDTNESRLPDDELPSDELIRVYVH